MSMNSSRDAQFENCILPITNSIMLSLLIAYILMMPLFVFVLAVGFQKWRKQNFSFSFLTTSSHIDVFTYNVVVLDLLGVFGTWLFWSGLLMKEDNVIMAGYGMFSIFIPGQMLFQVITCLERYLAVVHPVFYLRLRGTGGVRIRNIIISCVWLVSFIVMVLTTFIQISFSLITSWLLSITSGAFCFCSLSVLCVLIRPGPGEGARSRGRIDKSKKRAFHTMIIITAVLSLRFFGNLVISVIQNLSPLYGYLYCLSGWSSVWFLVPSSLVLPLLFLQREGKLPGCGPKSDESA